MVLQEKVCRDSQCFAIMWMGFLHTWHGILIKRSVFCPKENGRVYDFELVALAMRCAVGDEAWLHVLNSHLAA